jgi:hypothetical protein
MIKNFHTNPKIFSLLGKDIYKDIYQSFAELVSNSYDACATNVLIRVKIDGNTDEENIITIEDDGSGMDEEALTNRFFNISVKEQPEYTECGRKRRGKRGVGRFSGFALGNTLEYHVRQSGQEYKFILNKNDFDKYDDINDIPINIQTNKTNSKDGVLILIRGISSILIPEDTLEQKLLSNFGSSKDFLIRLNGKELKVAEIDGEKKELEIEVNGQNIPLWIIKSEKELEQYGILIRINDRAIGEPSVFDLKLPKEILNKFYGEVDVSDLKGIDPNAGWDALFDNEVVKVLKAELKKIYEKISNDIMNQTVEEEYQNRMIIPEYKNRLDNLPSFSRKAAERTIKDSIKVLKYKKSELVSTIIELSIKSYEQHEVYEILKKINEAKHEDITKLAAALKLWGVKEIADILTLLQQRFQILEVFEEIINDKKTLELKGTHAFLADNMWIIDERYEWFISNKSLSTISEKILNEKYKGENKAKRPDLFLKMQESLSMRNEFLILELKKPGQKITYEDAGQGNRYANVINHTYTKQAFFNVYIVGSEYEEGIPRESNADSVRTIMMSYQEIVQEARARMMYIEKNLKENEKEIEQELYSIDDIGKTHG